MKADHGQQPRDREAVLGGPDGESDGLGQGGEAYRPRLFGCLVRLSRRREVAEDLLEETWVRLMTRSATLTDAARLGCARASVCPGGV